MSKFTVFTTDGRSSSFEDEDAAAFIVRWQESLTNPGALFPYAYLEEEVVHFNPSAITAVSVVVE